MNTKLEKFEWLPFAKMIAALAIPVALQNLLTTTGSMIDTVMISSLGEKYVASVGLCGQFSMLMFSCYWGFVGGGTLFISQYWGAKDDKGIARSYGMTMTCMLTVGIIFSFFAVLFPELVIKMYTDNNNVHIIGKDYLRIVGFAYVLQIISICMSCLLRSTERVKIPLYAALASVCTNTLFNWLLIFGHWGFPQLGVKGAAIATVLAAFVNVLVIVICALSIKYKYLFMVKDFFKWNKEFVVLYIKKCFPIICNELFIGVGYLVVNIVLGHQPEEAIAALAVFRTIEGLVIGFFAGFSSAASVLVGKEVGAGNTVTAYRRAIRIVYFCQVTIAVIVLILLTVQGNLLHLMNLNGKAFDYGTGMVMIYSVACVIRMGNWTQNDTYRSAGDATFGTLLEIIFMYVLVLPCLLISNYVLHAGFLWVFACCYVDEPIRYILMQIHMYSGKWIKPVTPEGKAGLEEFKQRRAHKA